MTSRPPLPRAGARRLPFLLPLLAPLLAMAEAPPTLDGWWGGDRTNLHVTATGATLEQDCATAEIVGAIRPDPAGRFTAAGKWRAEGGPTPADRADSARPARFTGQLTQDRLELTVAVEGGETRHYVLARGRRVKLIRCL
jgi:hypothetical protein